ncbi:hypothetical protein JYU34_009739 [Plutella xylostella]|uniref:Uncharacterized protein n=1 Tax=Plutella xylostella TaxID=51655 RepID=A0ABQ7QKA5_PLUXY|nr:hypothetical protein JYU34_009739 [Plutella xylostella]
MTNDIMSLIRNIILSSNLNLLIVVIFAIDPLYQDKEHLDIAREKEEAEQVAFEKMCAKLSRELYFDKITVMNKIWVSVYAWNKDTGYECMSVEFTQPTKEQVRNYFIEMQHHLDNQPDWEAATLVMTMRAQNRTTHTMLYRDPSGPPGTFHAVPTAEVFTYIESESVEELPLVSINLQILQTSDENCKDQIFLYFIYCKIGVVLYTSVAHSCPSMAMINNVAKSTALTGGHHSCLNYLKMSPLARLRMQ